jgi:hypothetical protein
MSEYFADRWVVLEIDSGKSVIRKLFAGFYGGYSGGDSWQINSGITAVRIKDGIYQFEGLSGSIYNCTKNGHGMSGLQQNILAGWRATLPDVKIKEIDLEDIVAM